MCLNAKVFLWLAPTTICRKIGNNNKNLRWNESNPQLLSNRHESAEKRLLFGKLELP